MSTPSAARIAASVNAGKLTALSATQATLARIDALDPYVHALTHVRRDAAQEEARALDRNANGALPLKGVSVAVKEEYDVAGDITTLGGQGNSTPADHDCAVVARIRSAGAVIVARTNMPEFGQYAAGESEYHGTTVNPWNQQYSPGGSSAGSGAAVATGMVPIALGADGGGSLRIPASASGVFGLKPTRGRISSAPLAQHWHGLATFGALTRSAYDMALVLDVISGNEDIDQWTYPPHTESYTQAVEEGSRGNFPVNHQGPLRIRAQHRCILPGIATDPQVYAAFDQFLSRLMRLGCDVRARALTWPLPTPAFMAMHLSGMRVEASQVEHPDLLTARTKASAALGAAVTPQLLRAATASAMRISNRIDALFGGADLIAVPTMPQLPVSATFFANKGHLASFMASAPMVANTAIFNVSGHPAMSVHAGMSDAGVPIGAQIVARMGREDLLLALAAHLDTNGGLSAQWDASVLHT
ncbi:amidase [Schaalia suimastitidis]|uniref:amidase n=1 Tax=Schaalia suimastitidis TaxID=121163 RepID=UPI0004055990|nr:amidase family protein [Schaalia suimastitidis]